VSWSPSRLPGFKAAARESILTRDGRRCYLCGGEAVQVDHVVPLAEGGSNDLDNGAAVCVPCHAAKSAREKRRGFDRHMAKGHRPSEEHPSGGLTLP
jgi:5-methylcytosine-specific restriction protein A